MGLGIMAERPSLWSRGEVPEWTNGRDWKSRRGYPPLEGSNPSLSAIVSIDSTSVFPDKSQFCTYRSPFCSPSRSQLGLRNAVQSGK